MKDVSSESVLAAAQALGVFPTEATVDLVIAYTLRCIKIQGRITQALPVNDRVARVAAEKIESERLALQWCKGCFKLTPAGVEWLRLHEASDKG